MNQISLDINKSGQIINEPVVLRVGEKDQSITVNLLKDGQPYTSFTTATFFANKPSGAIVANDPANISNGVITYTVPQALVNEFGKITNAYFLIDGKVSTENFVIAVLQGVRVSDDLGDLIPGMGNLNVIYDKWKAKLDSIDRELQGIDAPKEVKNVVNNVLKDYANQLNDLKGKLNTLQTDVNNLKVPEIGGRNLLTGTSGTLQTVTNASGWNTNLPTYHPVVATIDSDTAYTARAWISPASYDMAVQLAWQDSSGASNYGAGNTISAGTSGYSTWTGTIPAGSTIQYVITFFTKPQSTASTVAYKEVKLERGSIATDWTPAPEDKVNVSDTANWQTQAIFKTGDFDLTGCQKGDDFGEFLKSDSVPKGFSIIRDGNAFMNWRIVKEGSDFIYGLSQDTEGDVYHLEVINGVYQGYKKIISNLIGLTITATDDTGKTVKLNITGIS